MTAHHPEDVGDHGPDRDLAHRPAVIAGSQVLDVPLQRRSVDVAARDPELVQRIDLAIRILAREGEQGPDQLLLDARPHGTDHAEVDDADPLPGLDEEVSRVRVGVKEPIPEDHLEDHPRAIRRDPASVQSGRFEGGEVVDLDPIDPLQGQHAIGRLFPKDARKVDRFITGKIGAEPFRVAALLDVTGLGPQGVGKLVHQADHVVFTGHRPATAGVGRQGTENLKILLDLIDDPGSLDLHDDRGAVSQRGSMNLADRGGRQRRRIETAEHGLHRPAKFGLDHGGHHASL